MSSGTILAATCCQPTSAIHPYIVRDYLGNHTPPARHLAIGNKSAARRRSGTTALRRSSLALAPTLAPITTSSSAAAPAPASSSSSGAVLPGRTAPPLRRREGRRLAHCRLAHRKLAHRQQLERGARLVEQRSRLRVPCAHRRLQRRRSAGRRRDLHQKRRRSRKRRESLGRGAETAPHASSAPCRTSSRSTAVCPPGGGIRAGPRVIDCGSRGSRPPKCYCEGRETARQV